MATFQNCPSSVGCTVWTLQRIAKLVFVIISSNTVTVSVEKAKWSFLNAHSIKLCIRKNNVNKTLQRL
jgi:hypothetical protein